MLTSTVYYASITRAEEKERNARHVEAEGPKTWKNMITNRFSNFKATTVDAALPDSRSSDAEKSTDDDDDDKKDPPNPENGISPPVYDLRVSEAEWKNASRAIRTAGWSSVFYLITTDILGPFSTP